MVHVTDDGHIAVIATLFEYGHPDQVIGSMHDKLNLLPNNVNSQDESPIRFGLFHPAEIRETSHKYYRSVGSFNARPCTENIIYIVLAKVTKLLPKVFLNK